MLLRHSAAPAGKICRRMSCSPPPGSVRSRPKPPPAPTTATGAAPSVPFFKNKFAVALLIALVVVVAFAFIQPHLPGQADPNLCAVDPVTGIQYRNIAPGQDGFIWGSNSIGQDLWARIWAGARTSLTIAFFVAPHRSCGGHYRRCAVGLCARAGLCVHRAVQHLR